MLSYNAYKTVHIQNEYFLLGEIFVQDKENYPRPDMKELYGSFNRKMTKLDSSWHIE